MQELLHNLSRALKSEPDIAFAYLFGSVAKGRSGPLSDVDVAVYFDADNARSRFDRHLQLMSKLAKALQQNDVDVVSLQDAPVDLAFEVLAHGKLLFSKDDAQKVDFIFKILRKYHDEAQRRQFEWDVIREEIKRGTYGHPPRSYSRPAQKAA
ncbi:MAG: nucleotidyltransferase domain-containing protein [candidate division KSB1 bacterium]|nr:nucleotidyltransferase domain-containing protein [candidate division KSB1 bacterium]MDZ7368020.1 nucleotidyltransferase domain-containing protein [candidate division KSB1 bacterium]MDZ7405643.1 nucleotidyltransferase domain-containing protein [candidate division KSB1 bacterium]